MATLPIMPAGAMVTVADIRHQLDDMHQLVTAVLTDKVHYGLIPGTKTRNLLKPGAEIIFKAFLCSPRFVVTPIIVEPHRRYALVHVECEAVHIATGAVLSRGIGAADTEKWMDNKVDFGWLYNACEKVAKKRAMVDCALSLGAVSAHFSQDMEDVIDMMVAPDGSTIELDVLKQCPLHNVPWSKGQYGSQHKKVGGGYCDFRVVIREQIGAARKAGNVSEDQFSAAARRRYGTTPSKLNETEQAMLLELIKRGELDADLEAPAVPRPDVDPVTGEYFGPQGDGDGPGEPAPADPF